MRTSLIFIAPSLLLASACGGAQSVPYTDTELKAITTQFEPYCNSRVFGPGNWVDCGGAATYINYENPNGRKHIGKVLSVDTKTGRLNMLWGIKPGNVLEEVFYPGLSNQTHPGRILEVIPLDSNYNRWRKTNEDFLSQQNPVTST